MDTDYYRRLFHGAKEACEDWKYRCWMRKWNKCRKCGCFLDPGEGSICDDCRRAQEKVKIVPTIQEHGGQYRLFLKPDKKE